MNTSQLRQKIETQLNHLSPEKLDLVSNFLDSIQKTETKESSLLRQLSPIKRGKTAKDLLKHAAIWKGNDLKTCLNDVHETRSESQF